MYGEVLKDSELKEIEDIWKNDESLEKMQENWDKFKKFCGKIDNEQQPAVFKMLDELEERMFVAPASSRVDYHNAMPGGYIDHCLRVLSHSVELAKAWKVSVDPKELTMAALFHDFGKVGTKEEEYYITEQSDWHRKRGMTYKRNTKIAIPNAQLGLFTLNEYGVKLSFNEYYGILLNDGAYAPENSGYSMKEPKLSVLIHMADRWSSQCEKGRWTLLQPAVPAF